MDTLLQELVAIPSVFGEQDATKRIIDYVDEKLQLLNLHIEYFECGGYPAIVATTQKTKTPKVMLYAHLDVVAAPQELYKLRMEDGKYYGRGVLDMKSAVATYLHILKDIQYDVSSYDIGLMFTTDEEGSGNFGTGGLVKQGYIPQVCVMPDSGFDTNWEIERSAKGCWFAHVIALGVSAHGSRPWQGDSASIKLIKALNDIVLLFKDRQKPDTTTINIGMLHGGESINQIPAVSMASLDIRFIDMQDFYRLKRKIQAICDTHGVTLKTIRKWNKPTTNKLDHPLIQTFLRHVTLQTGITPASFTAYGASDARFFLDRGIPCVLMSPPGGSAHSNDEWLSVEGYQQYQLILRDYIEEVARTPAARSGKVIHRALTTTL
ncbi:MAG TPA: M20 family metallopeptidase [Candidatus Saccharimonadales bacterium]|nr:M20 family metallopeptidase [Candidatus Saccharimonadales bacterium]